MLLFIGQLQRREIPYSNSNWFFTLREIAKSEAGTIGTLLGFPYWARVPSIQTLPPNRICSITTEWNTPPTESMKMSTPAFFITPVLSTGSWEYNPVPNLEAVAIFKVCLKSCVL